MDRVVFDPIKKEVSFFGVLKEDAEDVVKIHPTDNRLAQKLEDQWMDWFYDSKNPQHTAIIFVRRQFEEGDDFVSGGLHQVFYVCSHFDEGDPEIIKNYVKFMKLLKKKLKTEGVWSLNYHNTTYEKVIFSCYIPYEEYEKVKAYVEAQA